jgi:hypothetical protein
MRITITLLSLIAKRFFRSPSFSNDLAIQIILGAISVSIVGYFLVFGFLLERVIVSTLKQSNAVVFLNGLLVYYFIGEFIVRYFFQSLPTLEVRPFLHLPIKRNKVVNFFLALSSIQVINIFVFLLFSRFAISAVAQAYGIQHAWIWLLSLWFISLIFHYVVVLLKVTSSKIEWKLAFIIVICSLIAGADYFGWIKLSLVAERFFNAILQGYTVIGALFLVVIFLYYVAHRKILHRLYPEEIKVTENQFSHSTNFSFLRNFGQTGVWMKIELKMLFRNSRTREVFFMSTMLLVQELILCNVMKDLDYGVFLFLAIACTGLFMVNYGQYTFSWQGDHFDFTLTQPTSLRSYLESKCWLLVSMTGLWFIFTVPLVYFGWEILFINLAATLYNIGVNTFIVMNMAMLHTTKLSLRSGGALNYEGAGASQWLIGIPFLFGPIIIYGPFSLIGYKAFGIAAVGLVGLIGIILHKTNIDFTYKRFIDRRYKIASSFRKQ